MDIIRAEVHMKKIVLSIAVLILMLFPASAETIRIAAMRGPTAMGLCGLMREAENGPVNGISYEFTLEGSPDAVVPLVVRGDVDIAAIPANLASVLYNRTDGKIEALAINTLGVLYIAERGDSVHSIEELRGRTIYSAGKGATPEYALLYVLSSNGLEVGKDVFIEWKSEHAECVAALVNDGAAQLQDGRQQLLDALQIGDLAEDFGVQMSIHMAESPIACMAAVHVAAATRNFMSLEVHSVDVPWWDSLVNGLPKPLVNNGYIDVPNAPGLGIESLNEDLIREKLHPDFPEAWADTSEWDKEWANDRRWS